MNICFVGSSNTIFTHSYLIFLKKIFNNVYFIDISKEQSQQVDFINSSDILRLYHQSNSSRVRLSYLKRLFKYFKLDRFSQFIFFLDLLDNFKKLNKSQSSSIEKFLSEKDIDVFVYFWGTTVKAEKKAIESTSLYRMEGGNKFKNKKPQSILIVNTYPVRSNVGFYDSFTLSFIDKRFFKSFNSVSFPSEEMKSFFDRNKIPYNKYQIIPDFLSSSFSSMHSLEYNIDFNNLGGASIEALVARDVSCLVFLGNTNFKSRTIDDVYEQIFEIAEHGICVWLQESDDLSQIMKDKSHDNINTFKPFSYSQIVEGHLTKFLSHFDGVLMIYNDINNARTASGFPTRFALSLFANIPVFVNSDAFVFLKNKFNGVVYEFNTPDDIECVISNNTRVGVDFSVCLEEYSEQWKKFITNSN
ncbi:hypothetical protein [Aeromonas caviae]|uniref:hypothetical protein n=1 Tax=Aeromonas caviae TaxID=648 RepID=UPI002B488A34|nr:hypothetical protein [Aeromonas caviae]